ncbi:MAG: hypothetical protein LBF21_02120, partial [Puniceicoccales bacterium]|nr:hypothetical protein [Puniceicoccales bacterium]
MGPCKDSGEIKKGVKNGSSPLESAGLGNWRRSWRLVCRLTTGLLGISGRPSGASVGGLRLWCFKETGVFFEIDEELGLVLELKMKRL